MSNETLLILGDSWATLLTAALRQLYPGKVLSRAQPSTTATQWDEMLGMSPALAAVRSVRFVLIVLGINDARWNTVLQRELQQPVLSIEQPLRSLGAQLLAVNPQLDIVSFGYDLLCSGGPFETLEAQCGPGRANESAPCYNRALASLQRTHESAAAAVNRDAGGERWTVLNLQGALQAAGGVAGTGIGRPDMSRFTPTRFYERDCLHPNERGLRVLTHAIVQRYFVCPEGPPCVHDPTRRTKKGGRRRR